MPPIREYLCNYCSYQFEEYVSSKSPEDYRYHVCRCGSKAEVLPSMIGGYQGNMGGGSTRPKNSTSMPKKKAYTGHPAQQDEPPAKDSQLELDFKEGAD